ncbi:MAG: UDP-N-acetylglucosamine 1-carboxyvinyltransferase [Myxococcales bacterium]|nr:UDP-N-acetylglucosamine 1-carboxyvinyltransferase [Myxococcales bacterium]
MARFVIRGGRQLAGEITVGGNKNAALPMIAAALLTDEEVVLENVPRIQDVTGMLEILEHLGCDVAREGSEVRIRAANLRHDEVPRALCGRIRTSFLVVGPLMARGRPVRVYPPGGDVIGRRRLDAHFYGLRLLGVDVDADDFSFRPPPRLSGKVMFFDESSVTATEHILMAAVCAEGTSEIRNAASEPHVQDLARMLVSMGAKIEGIGTNTLVVQGVERLGGTRHRVISDHIEAGSYLALAAATGGEVTVHDTVRRDYWMIRRVFERFGLELELALHHIRLPGGQVPQVQRDLGGAIPRVDDGPWPQFPSDLMSPTLVLATQSEGTVLFFEKMFESRMYFVDPLIQMGANIIVCDPHRVVVSGKTKLRGGTVRSPDIRAGMALIVAALCADGEPSIVHNAHIVDRGYEAVETKLQALGADIVREAYPER